MLFIASLFVFSKYYGDKITQLVLTELNKQLNVKVDVKSIEFSVFKHFPYASIILNDVVVHASKTYNESEFANNDNILLQSKNLALQFNILDIVKKKYVINKISLNESDIKLLKDKSGAVNYEVLKTDTSSAPSNVTIDLRKIQARDCKYRYEDHSNTFVCKGFMKKCHLAGVFKSSDFTLETEIDGTNNFLTINGFKYHQPLNLGIVASFHVYESSYEINKCDLSINDVETAISGKIKKNKSYFIDLNINIPFVTISELIHYVPHKYKNEITKWSPEAELSINIQTKGNISPGQMPTLSARFEVENGSVKYKTEKSDLSGKVKIFASQLDKPSTYSCSIDSLVVRYKDSEIKGTCTINDFEKLKFKYSGLFRAQLENFKNYVPEDTIDVKGNISGNLTIETELSQIGEFDKNIFDRLKFKSQLTANDVSFSYKPNKYSTISNFTGKIKLENEDLKIDTCSLQYFGSRIELAGELVNVWKFIKDNKETLTGRLKVRTNCLDYNKIYSGSTSDTTAILLPLVYNVDIDIESECIKFKNYVLNDFEAQLRYDDNGVSIKNASCFIFGGRIHGDVYLSQAINRQFELKSTFDAQSIHIDKVFQTMNNFDQTKLTDKNIKGQFSGNTSLILNFDKSFKPITKSLIMECSATIANGKLLNFEPMKKLSKFIDVAELENVNFSTLQNNFIIKDEKIIIPKMEIRSSAISLQVSGVHNFNNNFEYNVQVYLSELLAKKHRNKHPDEYFGEIVDEGSGQTRLPIKITGTSNSIKIDYDTKTAKENVKESIKKEKSEIARIFREEFGIQKKDTVKTSKKPVRDEEVQQKFEIEFE